jgi:hypothetical protein
VSGSVDDPVGLAEGNDLWLNKAISTATVKGGYVIKPGPTFATLASAVFFFCGAGVKTRSATQDQATLAGQAEQAGKLREAFTHYVAVSSAKNPSATNCA